MLGLHCCGFGAKTVQLLADGPEMRLQTDEGKKLEISCVVRENMKTIAFIGVWYLTLLRKFQLDSEATFLSTIIAFLDRSELAV